MAIVVAAVVSVLGWTIAAASAADAGDKDVMVLSSWTPGIDAGTISGGTQAVTITNVGDHMPSTATFGTEPRPCDCAITGLTLSSGTLLRGTWRVTNLNPGETETMTVQYLARRSGQQSSLTGIPSTEGLFPLQGKPTAQRTHRAL